MGGLGLSIKYPLPEYHYLQRNIYSNCDRHRPTRQINGQSFSGVITGDRPGSNIRCITRNPGFNQLPSVSWVTSRMALG